MNKVRLTVDDRGFAVIQMNDTEGKNIFSDELIDDLIAAIDDLENNHEPHAVILSGLPDVFSGGADKDSLLDLADGKVHVKDLVVSERLVATPFPIIAAMEGHAVGGGLVMAACCDIVVAALESRYGAVFMSMGFTPGMGCTTLLADLVGTFVANEMMYTARRFKGRQLAEKGTNINYIVPRADVVRKATDVALQICDKNIKSVYLLKYTLSAGKKKKLVDARLQEDLMHRLSFRFPETKSTIESFYVD